MFFIKRKFLIIMSLLASFSHSALAMPQCEDVFPDVTTEYGTELMLPLFVSSTGTNGIQSGSNLSLDEGNYTDITVTSNGELNFTNTNGSYHANTVTIGQDAAVNFVAGDYYFSELNMLEDSQLTISGSGTVRIYVENDITLETEALINDDEDPLLLIAYGNLIASTGIRFSGLLYVVNNINVDNSIDIHGAITALNITLDNPEILDYVDGFLTDIDFDGTCESTAVGSSGSLLGYYSFEQSDFTTNILDESGNDNNGTNIGGIVTTAGQYCRGFDSNGSNITSITGNAFSTNIDLDDDVGETGTISFWYQANNDWGDRDRTLFNASKINGNNTNFDNKFFYLETESNRISFNFENEADDNFLVSGVIPNDVGASGVWYYISVTWNIIDDVFQIYIDGELLIENSETLGGSVFNTDGDFGELGNIVFGDNPTDHIFGGPFASADGNFDEVRIYSQVLSQSEIAEDMNDSTCIDTFIDYRDALLGYYPFEQSNFSNNVLDESANANNGTNIGGAVTTAGQYCNGFDSNGSNTTSITDNAFSTNIDLDDDVGEAGTISFWYQANNNWGDRDRTLFNASRINGNNTNFDNKFFYLETENNRLSFNFENEADDNFLVSGVIPNGVGASGVWYYISVTWNVFDDVFQIYIDGELLIENSEILGGSAFNTNGSFGELGNIVFGDNPTDHIFGGPFASADGNFDEVRVYSQVLTQSEIEADMNDNNCIDHYQIHHDISGLTCAPETITIKACSNSFNSSNIGCTEIDEPVSLTVNANNNAITSLAFTSSAELSFNNTNDEIVTLSVSSSANAALNGFNCVVNNTNNESNCNIAFQDTGFVFETDSASGNMSGIGNQLSGKPSNIGFNAGQISVEVVETNTDTGACDAILINQAIDIAAQCSDNSSCSENLIINTTDIDTVSNNAAINYTALNLGFSSNGLANFVVNYPDAGSLTLFARYSIPLIDGTPSGEFIEGETNFIVRPLGFDVTVTDASTSPVTNNPAAENANGGTFIRAGNNFNVGLIAKQWQAGDDSNNDGIPDVGADLSDNNTTINFKDEVVITHELVSPLSGSNPNLSQNTFTESAFINGEQSLSTSWREVGILAFNFHLSDNNYFNAGDIETNVPFVGRFIPDHYQQIVEEHGTLVANSRFWAYSGETDSNGLTGAIRYNTLPTLRITAYSSEDTITENYTITGDFIKLLASGITFNSIEADDEQLGVDAINNVTLTANLSEGQLEVHNSINGALTYSMSDLDHFVYTKQANSEIAPFIGKIPLSITHIEDSDGITQGLDNNGDELLETAIATDIEIRFGRLFIANSYGPETEALTIPMQLQIFNGTDYQVHSDDSITSISTENNEVILTYAGGDSDFLANNTASVNAITDTPVEGYVYFIDVTSINNARGRVDLAYESVDWLKHDWNNDDAFDDNPTASAQFGVFRGNDRIILWREITP